MRVALAGNPNCGKTTLFNALTGSTAHVGNWPGVTVDKREGTYKKGGKKIEIVDLPGIYSLSPYTPEEVVSRNYIINERPDCIINIIDATNLERNLYLTSQILEINVPVVIALNMMDLVNKAGNVIDVIELEKKLGVKVIEISALRKEHLDVLMDVVDKESKCTRVGKSTLLNSELDSIIKNVKNELDNNHVNDSLFYAIKLIENDEIVSENLNSYNSFVSNEKKKFGKDYDFEEMVANLRYKYITDNFGSTVSYSNKNNLVMSKSDKIDKVLTHKIWGIPIFLCIMFIVFHFVFSSDLLFLNKLFGLEFTGKGIINFFTGMGYEGLIEGGETSLAGIPSPGVFLQSWMGFLTGSVVDFFRSILPEGEWYTGLICDGLLTGIDSIFSFIPQVMLLFLCISILEDSGYMARVAFIMDRAFRKFGLSGKAFIPLLMGFGCSVPAMMATKTLEDERERDVTIRLSPFFSCGAKAPVWAFLATVVAGRFLGDVFVFSIYLVGIIVAIVAAIIMKLFDKKYEVSPFIMELPNYHRPQFGNLMAHLWEKFKHFLFKASTIITASIIVIWFTSSFGWAFWNGMVDEIDDSILASLGKVLSYVFYPLGWAQGSDGWKYIASAITGLIAKEDVLTTMANLGLNEDTIALSDAAIYSFAVYNLFTLPCMAAVATAKSESSKKGFRVTMAWWLLSSYVLSFVFYWVGMLLGFNIFLGLLVVLLIVGLIILCGYIVSKKRVKAL